MQPLLETTAGEDEAQVTPPLTQTTCLHVAHIACPPEQLVVVGGSFDATTANVTAPHPWHNDFAENYTSVEGESMPDFFHISPPCHRFTDGCRGQYKGKLTYYVEANWPIQSLHWPTATKFTMCTMTQMLNKTTFETEPDSSANKPWCLLWQVPARHLPQAPAQAWQAPSYRLRCQV